MPVRIASWNVASLRTLPAKLVSLDVDSGGVGRHVKAEGALAALFSRLNCDIICLQETKFADWSKTGREHAIVPGFESYWSHSGKGHAGVVTYARAGSVQWFTNDPFRVAGAHGEEGGHREPEAQDELARGRCVLTDHGAFVVINVYVINGGRGDEWVEKKMQFYNALLACVQQWQQRGRTVIVCGDINTAHSRLDIYNPERFANATGFLPREREWISHYLAATDSVDAFRELHPHTKGYTFWDQMRGLRKHDYGWRIDAFYVSRKPQLCGDDGGRASALVACDIESGIMGSDHCPITLELGAPFKLEQFGHPAKGAANMRKQFQSPATLTSMLAASSTSTKRKRGQ